MTNLSRKKYCVSKSNTNLVEFYPSNEWKQFVPKIVQTPVVSGFNLCKDEDGIKVDKTHFKQIVSCLTYLKVTRPMTRPMFLEHKYEELAKK